MEICLVYHLIFRIPLYRIVMLYMYVYIRDKYFSFIFAISIVKAYLYSVAIENRVITYLNITKHFCSAGPPWL